MPEPPPTDPCASISDAIKKAQDTINKNNDELSHFPEDLTVSRKRR